MNLIETKGKLSDLEKEVFLEETNEYFSEKNIHIEQNINQKNRF